MASATLASPTTRTEPTERPTTTVGPFIVRPGVDLQTRLGHCCDTWRPVYGTNGFECFHGMVLWQPEVYPAFLRAGEHR